MPSSSAARVATSTRGLLSIGQVLAKLSAEFPELSPSKLRFLEEQRLVSPARTEAGYRKFSAADIDRVRLVLTLQRDQYMPLRVIRQHLADLDAGRTPQLTGVEIAPTLLPKERRYTRIELMAQTGATAPLLQEAASAGLLSHTEPYREQSIAVVRALVELQRAGLEPRHLRSLRTAADKEASLIETAVRPLASRRDASARSRASERARELAAQLAVVRDAAVHTALGELDL